MRLPVFVLLLSTTAFAQTTPSLQFRGGQQSKHATNTATPVDLATPAGGKVMLFVDVTPKTGIHVYAPGSKDYIPITLKLTSPAEQITAGSGSTWPIASFRGNAVFRSLSARSGHEPNQ